MRSRDVLGPDGPKLGWPPLGAVVDDVDLIVNGYDGGCRGEWVPPFAFLSLPLDLAFDVLLLPFDLIGCALGQRKLPTPEPAHQPTEPAPRPAAGP